MINDEKTFKEFGYRFDDLSEQSHKLIHMICDFNGCEYTAKKQSVRAGRSREIADDCCWDCRFIKRKICDEIKRERFLLSIGVSPEQKKCYRCDTIKDKSEFCKCTGRKDGLSVWCHSCIQDYNSENREIIQEKARKYYYKNRDKIIASKELIRRTDVRVRIKSALRGRIRSIVSKKKVKKSARTSELLGCSIEFFLKWLESKFTEGMNWDNYGRGKDKWVIDHKIPCASFDLRLAEEQQKCFHYTNLQPLWFKDNAEKYCKLSNGQVIRNKFKA